MCIRDRWILRPFLPALIWATMVVVATWPLLLQVQRRFGNRRWPAVIVMTFLVLLVLVVPLSVAIATIAVSYTHLDVYKRQALVDVGLAEAFPYRYLRFDPALAPALRSELTDAAWSAAEVAWGEAMGQFVRFLYEQHFQDAQHAAALAGVDLANLLAATEFGYRKGLAATTVRAGAAPGTASFGDVVVMATRLEALLEPLGRRRALTRVVVILSLIHI